MMGWLGTQCRPSGGSYLSKLFRMAGRDGILFSVILYQDNLTLSPHDRE